MKSHNGESEAQTKPSGADDPTRRSGMFQRIASLLGHSEPAPKRTGLHRQLFERNQAVQILIDPSTGRIIDANPAATAFYGYSREQLRTMHVWDLNPMGEQRVREALERALQQQLNHFTFQHRLASGELRDIEVLSSPIETDGQVLLHSIIHDVTQNRDALDALRESERRFRAIFDQTFQFIGVLTRDGTVLESNQTGLDYGGLERDQVIGRPLWEAGWWKGDMPARIREAVETAASGRLYRGELEMTGVNGETVSIDFSLKPVRDEHGDVVLLIPEGRDVSDLKRVVRVLRETNQTMEALVESSPLPIIALDRTGSVKMWNPAAEQTFGWLSNEVLGRDNPLVNEENRGEFQEMFGGVLAGESFHNAEVIYRCKDQRQVYVSVSTAPLRDARGEIDGMMMLAMDITERKAAAEALRKSEAELRALFEAMTDVIVVLDANGRYVKVAPTNETLLVRPPEELIGKSLYDFFPSEEAARYHDYIQLALETAQPVKVEYSASIGGEEVWFVASISPMLENTVVWVARDITERKRAEAVQAALYRIAELTAAAEDMPAFYAAIHITVAELMYAGNFYIALYDPVYDELTFPYFVDQIEPPPPPQRPGEGLTGYVLRSGRPLWVSEEEMKRLAIRGSSEVVGPPAIDWIGVPLKRGEETFGVLAVQTYSKDHRFNEQDLELLTFVSKHIASAFERKQAAEALRASEERYRKLIETSPDSVIFTDINLRVLLANKQAAELYGVASAAEIIGMNVMDFIAPEERSAARDISRARLENGEFNNVEFTLMRQDGTYYPAEISAALILDADGQPQGYLAVTRDITERKRSEMAEREQRALAEALRDTAAALNSTLNLDDVLERILENVGRVVEHDSANIMLLQGNRARVARRRGYHDLEATKLYTLQMDIDQVPNLHDMIETGMPLCIPDTQQYPGWVSYPQTAWIRSHISAPIKLKGEVVGFLNLDSEQVNYFTLDHAKRLQAFADQAAVALQNAWLYESERKQLHLSQTLQEVGALLTTQLTQDEVLEHIFDLLAKVVDYDSVSVQILSEDGILELAAGRGIHDMERAKGFTRSVATRSVDKLGDGKVAVIPDTRSDPRWMPWLESPSEIRSWVGAALYVKGKLIGVLNVDSCTPNQYDAQTAETVIAFANQAAVAIENARLYARSQERNQQLALLNEITRLGSTTLDMKDLLQHLADRAGEIIGGDGCFITLWDPKTRRVTPAAAYGDQRDSYPLEPSTSPEERTLTRSVIEAGHALAVEDLNNTPHIDSRFVRQYPASSVLGLPLHADGRDIGALLIAFDEPHHFTQDEIHWAEHAAELIGLAIAKAQAYAELEERVEQRTSQLRQVNQRLMMLTQLKDEFVANVSHELRTPITNIKLHHHLLQAKPESSDVYMERLIRETERLEYIINDLLRLSEMDQGDVDLNRTATDLNGLAQLFITDRTLLAAERGLKITFEPGEHLPILYLDQMLIGQSLSVLLTNALNYTPRGGAITVSTEQVTRDGKDWVVLSVSDTGLGIPVEEQPQLFQRFYRGRVGKESDAAGTGLGLAIAREVVERHNGRIEVISQGVPGKGSTFNIWLPVEGERLMN